MRKKCSKCSKTFPATNEYFYKVRDGLRPDCKKCNKEINKKWREENPERCKENHKKWKEKNPEKIREYRSDYMKNRYHNDIEFKLLHLCRGHIGKSLKRNKGSTRTTELIGCSIPELKKHLEKQFDDKMSWENQGSYWHMDHIIPCASFDFTDPEQQKQCFHYTNLQPLEAIGNIKKKDKILF